MKQSEASNHTRKTQRGPSNHPARYNLAYDAPVTTRRVSKATRNLLPPQRTPSSQRTAPTQATSITPETQPLCSQWPPWQIPAST
ncbi:hypothetical protein RB11843 [Rhodopirellula baltica SH 1]|uniref:Uncharacterized protein n=1 Tax=Rhodopirellula baltica (strain DSM 10527 / NCIMB 13988 / SH1) TaxID=243090 RepID=Q7UJK4_RHOBA